MASSQVMYTKKMLISNRGKGKKTAMIFDPGSESAAISRTVLERSGIEVTEWARSGIGWMAPFQKARPDFALIDLQLPKRDGLFVVQKIHELLPNCYTLLTHSYVGMLANAIDMRALAVGAHGVIQRPFSAERLKASIDRYFELSANLKMMGMIRT
jgi:DNA-binding NarL/FixJ family response regulator